MPPCSKVRIRLYGIDFVFQPFLKTFSTCRAVRVPTGLTPEKKTAFRDQIRKNVAKQAVLANDCHDILAVNDKIQQKDDLMLIEHEPAACLDPERACSSDQPPDINTLWWLTQATIKALAACEKKRLIHGGLQPGSLVADRTGRIKLTDFGIATAYESACGREQRNHVACELDPEQITWNHTEEIQISPRGWISPYFAPEILAGGTRLNPNSDQFSLGVMLYRLATGVHPLGVDMDDPELFAYFVPEAYPLQDARREWDEAFQRGDDSVATESDQPILAWANLIYRLLATEPGDRFSNFAQVEEQSRKFIPDEWNQANSELGESLELLHQQQYDPFLTAIGPWSENHALPALWRSRLTECLTDVEQIKAEQAALSAVADRLADGHTALDAGQLEQARAIVAEVSEKAGDNQAVLEKITELEHACDEHEHHIREKADAIVGANLDLAREVFARAEFVEARMIISSLLEDPLTSPQRAQEIEQLLVEVEQQAAHFARYRDEFEASKTEFSAGQLTSALQRLEQLRSDPELPDLLHDEVLQFATEVETELRLHQEHLAIIAQVEAALQRLDVTAAEETLAMLPFDTEDPHLIEQRDQLSTECHNLQRLLQRRDDIEELLRQGQADQALDTAQALLNEQAPPALEEQLRELAENCRQLQEQIQTQQIGNALESLTHAETAYQTGDLKQCRSLLRFVLPFLDRMEPDARQRAEHLDQATHRFEQAEKSIETAHRRLEHSEFDRADAELEAIDTAELPTPALQRITDLRAEIEHAREEYRAQRTQQLSDWLTQVAEHLERVEVDQAEKLLGKVKLPDDVDQKLSREYERLRDDTVRGRRILKALAKAQTLLNNDQPFEASEQLNRLMDSEDKLPAWATERIEKLRTRLAELEKAQRDQSIKRTQAALEAASRAIDNSDVIQAREQLEAALPGTKLSPEFQKQHEQLSDSTTQLEQWLPKLTALEEKLRDHKLAEAYDGARNLLKESPIPVPIEKRLRAVESKTHAGIVEHRTALSSQLQALSKELDDCRSQTKSVVRRIDTIKADPLTTQTHRDAAEQLQKRYDKLPKPRKTIALVATAAFILIAAVSAGWYFTRPAPNDNQQTVQPEPPAPTPRGLIDSALTRIQRGYDQTVTDLPPELNPGPWRLYFEPQDAFDTNLYAQFDSGQTVTLAGNISQTMLAGLRFDPAWLDRLNTAEQASAPDTTPTPVINPPDWPAQIAPQTIVAPSARQLTDILGTIAPRDTLDNADPPLSVLVDMLAAIEIGERTESNALQITLRPAGGNTAASKQFTLEAGTGQWRPVRGSDEKLRNLLTVLTDNIQDQIASATNDIQLAYQAGDLIEARRVYDQISPLQRVFDTRSLLDSAARLQEVLAALPPVWNTPSGYQSSPQLNPGLDYPLSLTKDDRTFLLINVPPADPLWNEIAAANRSAPITPAQAGYNLTQLAKSPPATRPWYIFYIETTEMEDIVDRDPQTFSRRQTQRNLPSIEQWLLAALKLRNQPDASDFIGGKWEWCLSGDQPWVCGGCDEIHPTLLPWPDNPNDLTTLWNWLNHPLVSQPRNRGDNLAGIRTVVEPGG